MISNPASVQRLADTPLDHPALWGEICLAEPSSMVIESNATILPHLKKKGSPHWWTGHQHGAFRQDRSHIAELNDLRGQRHIFQPAIDLQSIDYNQAKTVSRELVVYGGTIFDHFGHLLLDLTRLYQLSRVYRHSKVPIWVHTHSTYPGKGIGSPIAQQWLDLLGLSNRVKVIRKPIQAKTLVSSSVLYRDRGFVCSDFHAATSNALAEAHQNTLNCTTRKAGKIAYLSRHKLTTGTTKFIQEGELVERLSQHQEIDIVCPEELSFMQKLSLYRQYRIITGFPQACMNLKAFVPRLEEDSIARQVMLIAGPNSLSSNWINIDKACQFNDYYVDCPCNSEDNTQKDQEGFQRGNPFDVETAYHAITSLIS